ncbi:MAG: NAD-dependent epimerase/dehydratase family protein [Acidobacteriaceae bacterium]
MSLKHVVVTGANGFIGQHVCRRLLESGKEVTACIREQADTSVFKTISGSLRICKMPSLGFGADLSQILRNVDTVIHLAARVHVMRETVDDPLREFRKVNVRGTENLASIAVQNGVRRFIYLSSIKVNGEMSRKDAFSADDPPGYCDPYGQSKWEAEESLRKIAIRTSMEWIVVRPPLVYGPWVRGNFLALMKCVSHGIPLPLGGVHNSRSLVSVFNLSDLLCLLVDHPSAANNRFLVSDSEDISTPELVRRIALALHRSPRIMPCPESFLLAAGTLMRQKEAVQRLCSSLVLDRRKTSEMLGWTAPVTLDCALDRTAEWFIKSRGSAA